MSEPFDVYVDQFLSSLGPYGATLTFQLSSHRPAVPGSVTPNSEVGTIRMSLEHLKAMVFILKRQVSQVEKELGIDIPIAVNTLNSMHIAPEDWQTFWRHS